MADAWGRISTPTIAGGRVVWLKRVKRDGHPVVEKMSENGRESVTDDEHADNAAISEFDLRVSASMDLTVDLVDLVLRFRNSQTEEIYIDRKLLS